MEAVQRELKKETKGSKRVSQSTCLNPPETITTMGYIHTNTLNYFCKHGDSAECNCITDCTNLSAIVSLDANVTDSSIAKLQTINLCQGSSLAGEYSLLRE